MKSIITILIALFISISNFAQQGINYKALIKDGSGNVLANQSVTVLFSILKGLSQTIIYQESHTPITDTNGIVILNIGEGTPISGNYTTIDWGADQHFLNVQIDTSGGSTFTDMGTTEFMAVPYAKQADTAETAIKIVTRTELDALTPVFGQLYFDSTDGFVLFRDAFRWIKIGDHNDCFPATTIANAGLDQTITTNATSTTLTANTPVEGTGTWSILSGTGGSLSDINDPTATFIGTSCTDYTLEWRISGVCGSSPSTVNIFFREEGPTTVNAGSNIYSPSQTTINLSGNTPVVGIGTWSVLSGIGGSFSDANNPNASFTGNNNTKYTLRWTITTSYCSNNIFFDEVDVYLGNIIGQFRDGGIVFYIDGTGQHGLVCDITSQSATWGCKGTLITGADGTAIGSGAQNTIDIEAGCTTPGTAADFCANLTLNSFTDWFLPSKDELAEMYNNRAALDVTSIDKGGTIFGNTIYQSSSEWDNSFAWMRNFTNGGEFQVDKSSTADFRAIRAF